MKPKYIKTDKYYLLIDEDGADTQPIGTMVWNTEDDSVYKTNAEISKYPSSDHIHTVLAHLPMNGAPVLEGVPLLPPNKHVKTENVLRWVKVMEKDPIAQGNYCIRTIGGHYTTAFFSLGGGFNEYTKNIFGRENAISEWLEETYIEIFNDNTQLQKLIRDFKYMAANSGNERVGALCNEGWMMLTDFLATKKQFSLDDMKAALKHGINIAITNTEQPDEPNVFKFNKEKAIKDCVEYTKSIQQQYEFVPEIILWGYDDQNGNSDTHFQTTWQTLKTIHTPQGQTVVGEWKPIQQ